MMDETDRKDAYIYKANYLLQSKVGRGALNRKVLEECQKIIDENDVDFAPMARGYLTSLQKLIEEGRAFDGDGDKHLIDRITSVAMQLRANAGIFHFPLISTLSLLMLWLVESVDELDDDVLDISQAYHDAVHTLIAKGIRNPEQAGGCTFEEELKNACERYFRKSEINPQNVFYVEF